MCLDERPQGDTEQPAPRRLHARLAACLLLAAATGAGCTFEAPASSLCGPDNSTDFLTCMLDLAPVVEVGSDRRGVVYDTPQLIRVVHGESCVSAPNAVSASALGFRVQQSASVPSSLDSGTVFLNGWSMRYANGDHHVQGLGAAIVNISETRDTQNGLFTLNWEAGGVLSDQNGDDPYDFCYAYTLVFWSRRGSAFDAVAFARGLGVRQEAGSDPGNGTALRNMEAATRTPYGPGVVLPQGFALIWDGDGDRHVLQTGFDFGDAVSTLEGGVSWTSRTLLKDNDDRHDYFGAELVSVLAYSSPQMLHPVTVYRETPGGWQGVDNDISLEPRDSESFCTGVGAPSGEERYKIEGVPFEYAVPVLKGWELGYLCSDHHVREIGAGIKDFRYERAPGGVGGTLYYTLSVVLSDDSGNVNYGGAVVDVFGMNARGSNP